MPDIKIQDRSKIQIDDKTDDRIQCLKRAELEQSRQEATVRLSRYQAYLNYIHENDNRDE